MTGEDILRSHVEGAHTELHPGQAIDVTSIIAIITAIMEAIRGCRNPESAKAHIKRGSLIAVLSARNAIASTGYRGNTLKMARELVSRGADLTDDEIEKVVSEVGDIPQPPPHSGGGWPVWTAIIALVCCLAMGGVSEASWPVVSEAAIAASETSWPVSIPQVDIQEQAATITPQAEVRQQLVIPAAQPWSYSGDNGTRESMINHLLSSNHRGSVMRWMGITDPGEYEAELAKLTYSELHQLHSADHEHLTVPGGATTTTSTSASRSSASVASASGGRWETQRSGLFGRRTQRVWVPAGKARSVRMFSGGCPGGACPR